MLDDVHQTAIIISVSIPREQNPTVHGLRGMKKHKLFLSIGLVWKRIKEQQLSENEVLARLEELRGNAQRQ